MYLCLFTVFGCFFYLFFAMSLFIFDDVPRNKTSAFFFCIHVLLLYVYVGCFLLFFCDVFIFCGFLRLTKPLEILF